MWNRKILKFSVFILLPLGLSAATPPDSDPCSRQRRVITRFGTFRYGEIDRADQRGSQPNQPNSWPSRGVFRVYRVLKEGPPLSLVGERDGTIVSATNESVMDLETAIGVFTEEINATFDDTPGADEIKTSTRVMAYMNRGLVWRALGEPKLALLDFREAIKLEPRNVRANFFLGETYLDDAIKTGGDGRIGRFYLGATNVDRRKIEYALDDLDEAVRLDRKFAAAYTSRGKALSLRSSALIGPGEDAAKVQAQRERSFQDALEEFNQALSLDPGDFEAYSGRAWLLATVSFDPSDLRLIPPSKDVESIPKEGKSRIYVSLVNQVLHVRIFDYHGNEVVNTHEKKLIGKFQLIEDLKKQLKCLWPPHELTADEKVQVIAAVTSIVDHTAFDSALRHGRLALNSATRACELTANKNLDCLRSRAASHAELGQFREAIQWQCCVVTALCKDDPMTPAARWELKLYESQKPYVPYPGTEGPR
jgi:tetratricopeptide (TPR) repeat protein